MWLMDQNDLVFNPPQRNISQNYSRISFWEEFVWKNTFDKSRYEIWKFSPIINKAYIVVNFVNKLIWYIINNTITCRYLGKRFNKRFHDLQRTQAMNIRSMYHYFLQLHSHPALFPYRAKYINTHKYEEPQLSIKMLLTRDAKIINIAIFKWKTL